MDTEEIKKEEVAEPLGHSPTGEPVVLSELDVCKRQAEEYLNGWKRAQADFINYKKDEAKRMEEFVRFSTESVILELVDALDDLYIAAKQNKDQGLDQTVKKFEDLLKKYDVERIKTDGAFDPVFHEAVGGMEGDKLEEVRAGYTMHSKVIRPARIKITK